MEELDFKGLLDQRKDFPRGEKGILGHIGTVQTLLSLIFNEPILIRMVGQGAKDGNIIRMVDLMAGDVMVASATSEIPQALNRKDVLQQVKDGKLGLGQIVVTNCIPNKRILIDVARDKSSFWRTYVISGPSLCFKIKEMFLREPFHKVGWL